MQRIAYVTNLQNTFTQIDKTILQKRYHVDTLYIGSRHPRYLLQTWQIVNHSSLVVAWFASWHSLPAFMLAAIKGIPRLLITGGYDVACVPEIDYGLQCGGLPKQISKQVFRLTDYALAFSDTACSEAIQNISIKPEKISCCYLGVPENKSFLPSVDKQALVLTVGGIDAVSVRRKGIREFVESARYLPDVRFVVVGKHRDDTIRQLRAIAPDNVEFTGFISDEALNLLFHRASVYVQASYHEGFGLSVAQAMLAGCVPVVSTRGSLPELVGETGFYVQEIEPAIIADTIQNALNVSAEAGMIARRRVLENFTIEQRADGLYQVVERLLSSSPG